MPAKAKKRFSWTSPFIFRRERCVCTIADVSGGVPEGRVIGFPWCEDAKARLRLCCEPPAGALGPLRLWGVL